MDFYTNVLGFGPVRRPGSFNFDVAWLFSYGIGIHLLQSENPDSMPEKTVINPKDNHISFQCESMAAVEKKPNEMEIKYVRQRVEEGGIYVDQLFFHDPDGFMVEICKQARSAILYVSLMMATLELLFWKYWGRSICYTVHRLKLWECNRCMQYLCRTREGLAHFTHESVDFAVVLLVIIMCAMAISISTFIFLTINSARREMYLFAALIKQLEATQQAERKNMNKSFAFAQASHDIRGSLAAIIGLIQNASKQVGPGSELQINLTLAETCTEELLGMLTSILDTSKIEAGQTQLEEEEFDLEQLLEDVVDFINIICF